MRAVGTFLIEGYWPQATVESLSLATNRLDESLDRLRSGGPVLRTVAVTLVPQDEAAYWIVRAPTAEIVAAACAQAGLTVERIVEAIELPTRS